LTETKACKVVWEKDHKLGWRMKVIDDCESLDAVLDAQNPSKKLYLKRLVFKT
jgi:hypothetical protein